MAAVEGGGVMHQFGKGSAKLTHPWREVIIPHLTKVLLNLVAKLPSYSFSKNLKTFKNLILNLKSTFSFNFFRYQKLVQIVLRPSFSATSGIGRMFHDRSDSKSIAISIHPHPPPITPKRNRTHKHTKPNKNFYPLT